MQIAIIGYGKMGKRIEALSSQHGCEVELVLDEHNNVDGTGMTAEALKNIKAAIDFSAPTVFTTTLQKALEQKLPMVVGTTGWLDNDTDAWDQKCKEAGVPVLFGSNFSLGVQLFAKLVARAGELFGTNEMFDAALNEVHHTEKADAPSGTAITLAQQFLKASGEDSQQKMKYSVPADQPVDKEAFYVTSQRLGSVYGEHELRVNSPFDDIRISHQARSRDAFAAGALKAAHWIVNQQPGFYLLEDVIEELVSG